MSVTENRQRGKEWNGKGTVLVQPSDLFLVINKQHSVIVEESAVFSSLNPKLFASATASKQFVKFWLWMTAMKIKFTTNCL